MSDWKQLTSEIVYETPWFKIHRDEVLNHNGKPLTYSYMELPHPGVCVMAVNADGQILLMRNYRYTVDETLWEFPAGHSDGQDLLVAARRELMEETGLASDEWTDLGKFYVAVGVGNIPMNYFLARNVHAAAGERDADEQITDRTFFDIKEINDMLRRGEITSYCVPLALYQATVHGLIKETK